MDECQGLLVTHEDGRVECLDDGCVDAAAPRHEWRAECADVPGLCACAQPAERFDRAHAVIAA
jgi:uncharacterized membrane protein